MRITRAGPDPPLTRSLETLLLYTSASPGFQTPPPPTTSRFWSSPRWNIRSEAAVTRGFARGVCLHTCKHLSGQPPSPSTFWDSLRSGSAEVNRWKSPPPIKRDFKRQIRQPLERRTLKLKSENIKCQEEDKKKCVLIGLGVVGRIFNDSNFWDFPGFSNSWNCLEYYRRREGIRGLHLRQHAGGGGESRDPQEAWRLLVTRSTGPLFGLVDPDESLKMEISAPA